MYGFGAGVASTLEAAIPKADVQAIATAVRDRRDRAPDRLSV
jgi:hypothetical protein